MGGGEVRETARVSSNCQEPTNLIGVSHVAGKDPRTGAVTAASQMLHLEVVPGFISRHTNLGGW